MRRILNKTNLSTFILATAALVGCYEKTTGMRDAGAKGQADAVNAEAPLDETSAASTAQASDEPNSTQPADSVATPDATKPGTPPSAVGTLAATGTTAISFTPVQYAAAQYPAFVYAVWITDTNNKYIKTVSARAASRIRYLDKWFAAAGVALPTQPDGVAGASINYPATPTPIAFNWDMKDKAGVFVPQGNYNINVQFTASNNTGLSLAIPITINASGITKTDTSMTTGITAVTAKHTP